jgi:hypothetical protein
MSAPYRRHAGDAELRRPGQPPASWIAAQGMTQASPPRPREVVGVTDSGPHRAVVGIVRTPHGGSMISLTLEPSGARILLGEGGAVVLGRALARALERLVARISARPPEPKGP